MDKVFECLIGSLFIAWVLSQFGFNVLFIEGFQELFDITITNASYYLIFLFLGVLIGFIDSSRKSI